MPPAALEAGRTLDRSTFRTTLLGTMVVLEPGEAVDSDRVKAECGACAMAVVHFVYEQWRQYGQAPPDAFAGIWDEYSAMIARVPEERRHLRIHLGHNCWVEPEEERFLTTEVIEAGCIVGTATQLADRLTAMSEAGLDEIMILPTLATKEKVLRDVATHGRTASAQTARSALTPATRPITRSEREPDPLVTRRLSSTRSTSRRPTTRPGAIAAVATQAGPARRLDPIAAALR